MKRPNPTLKEIEQWVKELPTIEELKAINGFEISKPYFFVRMEGRWHIVKLSPHVDVKNIGGKPENIQCFATGDKVSKIFPETRDSDSALLNSVKIEAGIRVTDNIDKFLMKTGLRKEFVEFRWEKSPKEIYEEQIEAYKKLYKINNMVENIFSLLFFFAFLFFSAVIYSNDQKTTYSASAIQAENFKEEITDQLSSEYQKLVLNKKILFLRRTGLSIASDSKFALENKPLQYFISRHFKANKSLGDDHEQKSLFLKSLSNEISKFQTNKSGRSRKS